MRLLRACVLAATLAGLAAADYESGSKQPMLGIEMSPPSSQLQQQNNLGPNQGTVVRQVFPGTAADAMGLKPGDVIVQVNGQPIGSMTDLRNEVGAQQVGDPVAVVVRRNGQEMPLQSTLREWPKNIPREPIDAAAEARFREWQQRRLARNRGDIQGVAAQARQLRERLDAAEARPPAPFTAAPALQDAKTLLKLMPAWKMAYRYDTTGIRPAPGPAPVGAAAPAGPAWSLRVELAATAATPVLYEL